MQRTFYLDLASSTQQAQAAASLRLSVDLSLAWKMLAAPLCDAALKSSALVDIVGCMEACRQPPSEQPLRTNLTVGVGSKLFYTGGQQAVQVPGWNYAAPQADCLTSKSLNGPCTSPQPVPSPM